MAQDDGAALVRRYFEAATAGALDSFDVLFAADYVNHHPDGGEDRGPEGMKEFVRGVQALLPDLSVDVQDLFANGDMVGARITLRGRRRRRGRRSPSPRSSCTGSPAAGSPSAGSPSTDWTSCSGRSCRSGSPARAAHSSRRKLGTSSTSGGTSNEVSRAGGGFSGVSSAGGAGGSGGSGR